jgi:phenylacetate-coenzyme A ligase PaaK-like adenylate-forming protein
MDEKRRDDLIEKYSPSKKNWSPVDKALFSQKSIYNTPFEKAKELRLNAIKYAFNYHFNNSSFYNRFCKDLEVRPEDIKDETDLLKIPLISDLFFKVQPNNKDFVKWLKKIYVGEFPEIEIKSKRNLFDNTIEELQKKEITLAYSSGTSGNFSFIPRDKITWDRQMYVCSCILDMLPIKFLSDNYHIFWLGPNPTKTHLYIGRLTLMLLELFDESKIEYGINKEITTKVIQLLMGTGKGFRNKIKAGLAGPFIAHEQKKAFDAIIKKLEKIEKNVSEIGIGGTPFFIEFLLSEIENRDLSFNFDNGTVITAGGWKTFTGIKITTDKFRERIQKILGIPKDNCRDIYGMVECNALNISCEGHYKHIPHSILYPIVLDEESEPVGYDEWGRYAFLDPLSNSYPGFIMTGDKVKLLEHCPICNRPGPVLEGDISRLGGVQDRGCGAVLASMFSEEMAKNVKKN